MVYEGGVEVLNDDGTRSRSTRPRRVAWLQMYVDMVKAGTVDNSVLMTGEDRVGLLVFSAGQSAFYQTGPNLIREVKSNNETLYNDLAVAPSPVGKSGVLGKGLMSMSVKADTAVPERLHGAGAVLHQPARHGRLRQAGRRLSVVRRGL